MVVIAIVKFESSEGTLSGIITLTIICMGDAPMLCAASIMFGLTSRRLLSTRRATNGNDAMTSGTIEATVPTAVPTIRRVSGKTRIIKIKNGTERRRFIITLRTFIRAFGRGSTPPFSPATSSTPSGRPMIIAKSVESRVTYIVSQIASGKSFFNISRASVSASEVNALSNIF